MEQATDNDIHNKLFVIDNKLTRLNIYLFGDEETDHRMGALNRLTQLENRIERLEKTKVKLYGIMIGMSTIAGWGISDILKSIFK